MNEYDTDISQAFPPSLKSNLQDAELHPLADITNKEIEEVKHLKHPPREVARVMEVVHLLLTQPTSLAPCDWNDVLRTVVRIDFLKRARSINLDGVLQQAKLIDYVCRKLLSSKSQELNKGLNKENARFLQDHVYTSCNAREAWITSQVERVQLRYFAGPEPLTPDRVRWASKARPRVFCHPREKLLLEPVTPSNQLQSAAGSIPVAKYNFIQFPSVSELFRIHFGCCPC